MLVVSKDELLISAIDTTGLISLKPLRELKQGYARQTPLLSQKNALARSHGPQSEHLGSACGILDVGRLKLSIGMTALGHTI